LPDTGSPLTGRRVLITRALDGAERTAAAFRAAGAVPVVAPTIETVPCATAETLLSALQDLHADDWLVVTSPTAAGFWTDLVPAAAVPCRVAVIGDGTAAKLRAAGYRIDLTGPGATGVDLAAAIANLPQQGATVLLPRSDLALPGLPACLQAAGYRTIDLALYETRTRGWTATEAAAAADADVVTLMSPSAVAGLLAQPGVAAWLDAAVLVAMGPTTAAAVQTACGRAAAVADPASLAGLVAAAAAACAQIQR
jgi:uroporphyrinogen-III synthase